MTPTSSSFRPRRESRPGRQRSQGIVLVVALILLVVITISSVVAMRSAQSNDMVSGNLRAQGLAQQAAEIALRYCEQQLISRLPITVFALNNAAITDEWRTAANWDAATGRVNTVPAAFLGTAAAGNGLVNYETPPQCIVRRLTYDEAYSGVDILATTVRTADRGLDQQYVFIWRITARGFSPDFQRNAAGASISGSEAWVQSTIRTVL